MSRPSCLVLVAHQDDRRHRFQLTDGEHELGSRSSADLRLRHPTVSRRHARLTVGNGEVTVEDLESSNGTFVDGRRLRRPITITSSQRLSFGSVDAHLEWVREADLEAAVHFDGAAYASSGSGDGVSAAARAAQDSWSETRRQDQEDSVSTPAPTVSIGSLRTFTLDTLPRLLERLEDGVPSEEFAALLGAALHTALPSRRVEVLEARPGQEEAVLFAAEGALAETPRGRGRPLSPDSDPKVVEVHQGSYLLRARFLHAVQAQSYRPLVVSCARLLGLALAVTEAADSRASTASGGGGSSFRPHRPTRRSVPSPPDPPSVEARVQSLYADAARVALTTVSVLVLGESGTGKELLARFLHAASERRERDFVALNCAALPEDLLEAELFGIERAVATGVDARPGKFELADGGTLFLDEVADMAPATQARILRVLQEQEVYRLGGREPQPARVRVLAATNRDLEVMVEEGSFRLDLYHRIADWTVELPPLRRRPGDIPNLAGHFLHRAARRRGVRVRGISRAALSALASFHWPGNVRQLERAMERAAIFVEDEELLQTRHLPPEIAEAAPAEIGSATAVGDLRARLEAHEAKILRQAIADEDGNLSAAARSLGIGRSTLYRRLRSLGLEGKGDEDASGEHDQTAEAAKGS